MDIKIAIILIIVAAVVFAILGFIAGQIYRKKVAEAAIGSANQEATRIINAAMTTAEQKKKEAILEAKDQGTSFRGSATGASHHSKGRGY